MSASKLFTPAFVHEFRETGRANRKLMIISFVLNLMSLPLLLSAVIIQYLTVGQHNMDIDFYSVIAVFSAIIAFFLGLGNVASSFTYLHTRTEVDKRMALPLSRKQRFIADFFGGLCSYELPFLGAHIISIILLIVVNSLSWEKGWADDFAYMAKCLPAGITMAVLIMAMAYTTCVLTTVLCGSRLEATLYTCVLNGLLAALPALVLIVGDEENAISRIMGSLPYFSPIGGFIYGVEYIDNLYSDARMYIPLLRWVIIFLVFTVLYGVCAYLVFRIRKAEATGEPVVYDAFYFGVTGCCVVCIVMMLMFMDEDTMIPAVIITAVFYLIMGVIRYRGFKKIKRIAIGYAISVAAAFGIFLLVYNTHLFGVNNYVPANMAVDKVFISYTGMYESEYHDFYDNGLSEPEGGWCIEDRDNIARVTAFHKMIVQNPERKGTQVFSLVYRLRSGRYVSRTFGGVPLEWIYENLSPIDCTQEGKRLRFEGMETIIKNQRGDKIYLNAVSPEFYGSYPEVFTDQTIGVRRDESFENALCEALKADIEAQTVEQYTRGYSRVYLLSVGDKTSPRYVAYLDDSYRNTLSLIENAQQGRQKKSLSQLAVPTTEYNMRLMSIEMAECLTGTEIPAVAGYGSFAFYDDTALVKTWLHLPSQELVYDPDIDTLVHAAMYDYAGYDADFMLEGWAIPRAYSDIARRVFVDSYVKDLLYDSSYRSGKEIEVFLDCYGDMLDADVREQIEEYSKTYAD